VLVLAGAALVLIRLDVFGKNAEATPASISAQLKQRMTKELESLPAEGHAGHGGTAGDQPAKTVCGVRVYGYEPEQAKSVAEVVTVYGFHFCAVAESNTPWDWATKLVAPTVMHLNTDPPTFQMAQSTADTTYIESLKQLIPERFQKLATEGALEPETMAELQRRYAAAAG
jgi:hypothetical protein